MTFPSGQHALRAGWRKVAQALTQGVAQVTTAPGSGRLSSRCAGGFPLPLADSGSAPVGASLAQAWRKVRVHLLDPETTTDRSGSKNDAECIQNQTRRPILRPSYGLDSGSRCRTSKPSQIDRARKMMQNAPKISLVDPF